MRFLPRSTAEFVAILAAGAAAFATPPMGFIVNQILATGSTPDNVSEQVQIAGSADGSDSHWQLQLQAQGSTDFYVQQLVLAPGGYSGWHSHPGILIGTVVAGSIDFYDANCQKRSVGTGQIYIENNRPHGIINTGSVNAELSIAYLLKNKAARRIEESAPQCAPSTGIP